MPVEALGFCTSSVAPGPHPSGTVTRRFEPSGIVALNMEPGPHPGGTVTTAFFTLSRDEGSRWFGGMISNVMPGPKPGGTVTSIGWPLGVTTLKVVPGPHPFGMIARSRDMMVEVV